MKSPCFLICLTSIPTLSRHDARSLLRVVGKYYGFALPAAATAAVAAIRASWVGDEERWTALYSRCCQPQLHVELSWSPTQDGVR